MGPCSEADLRSNIEIVVPATAVVGCEINPRLNVTGPPLAHFPYHTFSFAWFREFVTCSVHHSKPASHACIPCVNSKRPPTDSYFCSVECYRDAWKNHRLSHCHADATITQTLNIDCEAFEYLGEGRTFGSQCGFVNDSSLACAEIVVREGKQLIKVGSTKSYVPSRSDEGFSLRFESFATDWFTGAPLSLVKVVATDPVICAPDSVHRRMIQCFEAGSSLSRKFTVLSYNILSQIYAYKFSYYCPSWALAWEYRRENLLDEIVKYRADILCLQEVQSDHFENFFKPQLAKHAYSAIYKKKTTIQLYTGVEGVADGCAIFFLRDKFQLVTKHEIEFEKEAMAYVEEFNLTRNNIFDLAKGNVALVAVLQTVKSSGSINGSIQSTICVANTHIHAHREASDVKLFQVSKLVNRLEEIAQSGTPVLICGDMNSRPGSDPHKLLVTGRIDPSPTSTDDRFGVYKDLTLHHSLRLKSAYSSLLEMESFKDLYERKMNHRMSEPQFTVCTPTRRQTLDYMCYTADSLKVEALLELLDGESEGLPLPSPQWSSDHIALMATFSIEQPCQEFVGP